jgi:fibronectin type 3 domain-containing protein
VSGTMNPDVIWSATNGTVTSGGQFLAPGVSIITRMFVKATSRDDPTKSASAGVTVIAQAGEHSVDLSWNASTAANIVGYNVYRGQASNGPYSKINAGGLVAATLYSDTSVANGVTYFYAATVVDSSGQESAHSNQVQAAIPW